MKMHLKMSSAKWQPLWPGGDELSQHYGCWCPSLHHQTFNSYRIDQVGVPYFPDMSGWSSGPIFSGEVRFYLDIDRGTSGGDFENYTDTTTHIFCCF